MAPGRGDRLGLIPCLFSFVALTLLVSGKSYSASVGLVISEVYGGGGNSNAVYANDYIELFNTSNSPQSLLGYSVQYIPSAPAPGTQWQATDLSLTLSPDHYYLISEAAGPNTSLPSLPTPDANGSIDLSGTSGTVALVNGTTLLTCKTAADCAADPRIIDEVGYGTAVIHEGSSDAPGLSNSTAASRRGNIDTDSNGSDFSSAAPNPLNSGYAPPTSPVPLPETAWLMVSALIGIAAFGMTIGRMKRKSQIF